MMLPIIIVGAGGHAIVVADALLAAGARVLGFTDADPARHGLTLCGLPVLGDDRVLDGYTAASMKLANGIGGVGHVRGESLRRSMQQRLTAEGWNFVSVRHPTAVVSPFARVAAGTHLLAACVVQAGADVGEGCIVNTAAVVEHDVTLGPFVHIAPRALVCGRVSVGANCHVGAGAVIREGVRIGADTVVGAGAAVIRDCVGGGVLIGVPARLLEYRS